MNEEVEMIKVFWENVEFFIEKYNIPWSALLTRKDIAKAKKHELNITLKRAQRITERNYTFDKSKAKVAILASTDRLELEKEDANIIRKYNVLDTASGDLKTQHETIYIKSYLTEKK